MSETPKTPETVIPQVDLPKAELPKIELPPAPEPKVEEAEAPASDEKSILLQRAKMMNLRVSNNIGLETLRAKIAEALKASETAKSAAPAPVAFVSPKPADVVPAKMVEQALPKGPETHQQIRDRLVKEKLKLVRLRITNLDPKKKNIPGEIITVGNKFIGTVKKFIPFGEVTENGYHVPFCIYEQLKARKFLHIRTIKMGNGRGERIETSMVPEFALEVLPPLTPNELKELARMQAAKKGGGEE